MNEHTVRPAPSAPSSPTTHHLSVDGGLIAYDLRGAGPLVVLAHGMGDTRHSYRFIVPALVAAGYRVANVDIRGCGDSSTAWSSYTRTDIATDLIALVRHLGGPAVIVGQSISGGAATIAAATAPDLITGIVELAPFTRKQSFDLLGVLKHRHVRAGMTQLTKVMMTGSLKAWMTYLEIAIPTKPADWDTERTRIHTMLTDPDRMKVLHAMTKTTPADAGAHLGGVRCPVLVIEGSADPDWPDPHAEGMRIVADLPKGLGEVAVIDGAGHYPHTETPTAVLALLVPFLGRTLPATTTTTTTSTTTGATGAAHA